MTSGGVWFSLTCPNLPVSDVEVRRRAVLVGYDLLLQCELSSNLASPLWTLDGSQLQGYGLSSGYRTGTDGLLIIEAQPEQSGLYTCYAVENQVKVAVVSYRIIVLREPRFPPNAPPDEDRRSLLATSQTPAEAPVSESPLAPPPAPLLPHRPALSSKNLEAMYLSLVTILGSLCVVLAVVLVYVGFCLKVGHRGRYSLRAAAAYPPDKRSSRKLKQQRNSSLMELKTISSHCNGNGVCNGVSKLPNGGLQDGGLLQIVPGEGTQTPSKEPPPPAPPLPPTPQFSSPGCSFTGGLSATLPSVLRRMNGNSYVLLRQSDAESTSPLCYSFAEELNRILEKRKHTQLLPRPDESSV